MTATEAPPLTALFAPVACIEWLAGAFGPGPRCPVCLAPYTPRSRAGWAAGRRVVCRVCGRRRSWQAGSDFFGSRLPPEALAAVVRLLGAGLPVRLVADLAGVTPGTVRRVRRKLGGSFSRAP